MVPPSGAPVRASYRAGGGGDGNLPAGGVTELRTALAGVEGVVNLEPATGGSDAEDPERLAARAPRALRHGGRAVAASDYEDLAAAASAAVTRAVTVPPPVNPFDVDWVTPVPVSPTDGPAGDRVVLCHAGPEAVATKRSLPGARVTVVVAGGGDDPVAGTPEPGAELVDLVHATLAAHCPGVLAPTDVDVLGPLLVPVDIHVTVAATSLDAADRLRVEVAAELDRFLHPLRGRGGGGWPFGRLPHRSDVYAVVEALTDVRAVLALTITPGRDLTVLPPADRARLLVTSGRHSVEVTATPGRPGARP
jgi:predicted phage baseplate assembly protein